MALSRKMRQGSTPFQIVPLRFEKALNLDLEAPQGHVEYREVEYPTEQNLEYGTELRLQISPIQFTRLLLGVIATLLLLSTIGQIARHIYHHEDLGGYVRLFYVDEEGNVPTAYSGLVWLLCAGVAGMIAVTKQRLSDRFTRQWKWLAFIFLYLALDEIAAIHEMCVGPLRQSLHVGGLLYFTWVIPGALLLTVVAISYLKFLKHLPTKIRNLLLLAGALFVTGALGIEMIGGWYSELHGAQADLIYALTATVEEACEMLGVLTLFYALLSYMGSHVSSFGIQVLRK
jgi:hypothetical protein